MPVICLKIRWKWNLLMPAAAANVARSGNSAADSIRRHALVTPLAYCWAAGAALGLQRLQARKPARSASSRLAWKSTFRRSAGRDAQDGRQYTPVVLTE